MTEEELQVIETRAERISQHFRDIEFIACARTDILDLIAEVRQLQQEQCPHMVKYGRLCQDPDEV